MQNQISDTFLEEDREGSSEETLPPLIGPTPGPIKIIDIEGVPVPQASYLGRIHASMALLLCQFIDPVTSRDYFRYDPNVLNRLDSNRNRRDWNSNENLKRRIKPNISKATGEKNTGDREFSSKALMEVFCDPVPKDIGLRRVKRENSLETHSECTKSSSAIESNRPKEYYEALYNDIPEDILSALFWDYEPRNSTETRLVVQVVEVYNLIDKVFRVDDDDTIDAQFRTLSKLGQKLKHEEGSGRLQLLRSMRIILSDLLKIERELLAE
jgi:hypothetical protein